MTARKTRRKSKPWYEKSLDLYRTVWVVVGDAGCSESTIREFNLRAVMNRDDMGSWSEGSPRVYFRKELATRAKARRDAALAAHDNALEALSDAIEADD